MARHLQASLRVHKEGLWFGVQDTGHRDVGGFRVQGTGV